MTCPKTYTVTLEGDHALLGFIFHSDLRTPTIHDYAHGTQVYRQQQLLSTLPATQSDPCIIQSEILPTIPHHAATDQPHSFEDADWRGGRSHRCSVTWLMIMLVGGVIAYKTKFQFAVSLSSTEAEFIAAAEAGKMALYLQSILQQLGFPQ